MRKEQFLMTRKSLVGDKIVYKEFDVTKTDITNDDEHIIRVKFASFGNVDSAKDLLVKGCFSKSINERGPQSSTNRKIAFFWMHNPNDPIGKILNIWEEEDGAYADVQLSDFDAVPNAKRAWSQLNDGSINQFSFGFTYVWDKCEYDEEQDAFIVREVKLYEISVVSLGCNEQTEFISTITMSKTDSIGKNDKDDIDNMKSAVSQILELAEPPKTLTKTDNEVLDFIEIKLLNN